MSLRSTLLQSTALSTFGLFWIVSPAAAADLSPTAPNPFETPALVSQAVSSPNAKLEPFGGWAGRNDGRGGDVYGLAGAFSIPLGQNFGLQVDGLVGSWGGDAFYGTAGHLFWRDPSVGLAGIYAAYKHLNASGGLNVGQVAFEGEYYMPNLTARGLLGWEGGDLSSRVFTKLNLDWYATPDLALTVGYNYTSGNSGLALGAEWLTPAGSAGHRLSLFAEGRLAENNSSSILAGAKLYFGQAPTLIQKHRTEDPPINKDLYAFASLLSPAPGIICPEFEFFNPESGQCEVIVPP